MGLMLDARCSACAYHKRLFVGGSRGDCDWQNALPALRCEDAKQLSSDAEKGLADFDMARQPVRCVSCGELYALFTLRYRCGGEEHFLRGECPSCGSRLSKALHGLERWEKSCPECGSDIVPDEIGHWD